MGTPRGVSIALMVLPIAVANAGEPQQTTVRSEALRAYEDARELQDLAEFLEQTIEISFEIASAHAEGRAPELPALTEYDGVQTIEGVMTEAKQTLERIELPSMPAGPAVIDAVHPNPDVRRAANRAAVKALREQHVILEEQQRIAEVLPGIASRYAHVQELLRTLGRVLEELLKWSLMTPLEGTIGPAWFDVHQRLIPMTGDVISTARRKEAAIRQWLPTRITDTRVLAERLEVPLRAERRDIEKREEALREEFDELQKEQTEVAAQRVELERDAQQLVERQRSIESLHHGIRQNERLRDRLREEFNEKSNALKRLEDEDKEEFECPDGFPTSECSHDVLLEAYNTRQRKLPDLIADAKDDLKRRKKRRDEVGRNIENQETTLRKKERDLATEREKHAASSRRVADATAKTLERFRRFIGSGEIHAVQRRLAENASDLQDAQWVRESLR